MSKITTIGSKTPKYITQEDSLYSWLGLYGNLKVVKVSGGVRFKKGGKLSAIGQRIVDSSKFLVFANSDHLCVYARYICLEVLREYGCKAVIAENEQK